MEVISFGKEENKNKKQKITSNKNKMKWKKKNKRKNWLDVYNVCNFLFYLFLD